MPIKHFYILLFCLTVTISNTPLKAQGTANNDVGFCFNSVPSLVNQNTGNNTAKGLVVSDFNNDTYKDIAYLSINQTNTSFNQIKLLKNNFGSGYNTPAFSTVAVNPCAGFNFSEWCYLWY
jgi:hypothetical protein